MRPLILNVVLWLLVVLNAVACWQSIKEHEGIPYPHPFFIEAEVQLRGLFHLTTTLIGGVLAWRPSWQRVVVVGLMTGIASFPTILLLAVFFL